VSEMKSHYAARSCSIQHVHELAVRSDGIWLGAATGRLVGEQQPRAFDAKHRERAAARICGEQPLAILTQRERALRLERVDSAAAASAAGRVGTNFLQ